MFEETCAFIGAVAMIIVLAVGTVALTCLAMAKWECGTYEGAPTKVMAATCYVKEPTGKWVRLDSYVRQVNVNVQEK